MHPDPSYAVSRGALHRTTPLPYVDPVPETSTKTVAAPPETPVIAHLVPVDLAATVPTHERPWAHLGLKADQYARIREILGRRPTSSELAMYSVMWSEHCSYKSRKVHLQQS